MVMPNRHCKEDVELRCQVIAESDKPIFRFQRAKCEQSTALTQGGGQTSFDIAPFSPVLRGEGLGMRGFALSFDWFFDREFNVSLRFRIANKPLNLRLPSQGSTPHPLPPLPEAGRGGENALCGESYGIAMPCSVRACLSSFE